MMRRWSLVTLVVLVMVLFLLAVPAAAEFNKITRYGIAFEPGGPAFTTTTVLDYAFTATISADFTVVSTYRVGAEPEYQYQLAGHWQPKEYLSERTWLATFIPDATVLSLGLSVGNVQARSPTLYLQVTFY